MKTRASSIAFAVTLCVMASAAPACAGTEAIHERILDASTTFWSVEPAPVNGVPDNAPLVIGWTVTSNTAYSYFDAVNTGGEPLSSVTFSATSVALSQNSDKATVTFELCRDGTWNPTTNQCSGTVVPLGSYTGPNTLSTEITQELEIGQRLALRATTPQNRRTDLTTSVSLSVSRSSARPALTGNS